MDKKLPRNPLVLRVMLIMCAVAIVLCFLIRTPLSYSKYMFRLDSAGFELETAPFELQHTARSETVVYNDANDIVIDVFNNRQDTMKVSSKDIKFTVSIHPDDALAEVPLPHPDFSLSVNGQDCGSGDISDSFILPAGTPVRQELRLHLFWVSEREMDLSNFALLRLSVTSPYREDYLFRLTVLSKRMIDIAETDMTNAFGNEVRDLSLRTAPSFGASLPMHRLLVRLSWDEGISIDGTNPLILAQKSETAALNSNSIVHGGTGADSRFVFLCLPPSAKMAIRFYSDHRATEPGSISAELSVAEADLPYYNTWQSGSGWVYPPDGGLFPP